MLEVEVRNFQSIDAVNLKVEGFTALVGRSNIGKSALVRAVKAALTGAPVSSFVRHGKGCLRKVKKAKTCKCFASVHLKTEGFDLLWEKGDAINRYTFNGVIYDKAEKGTPEFLSPAFLPVKVGDQQTLLQVADQFSAIFLLDQTGGTVADVLSDVARLDRINVAMRLAEKDRKEAVSTRKVREKDVTDLQTKLAAYDGLDAAVTKASEVQADLAAIESLAARVEQIDGFMASGSALGQRIKVLTAGAETPVPDPETLETQGDSVAQLEDWVDQLEEAETAVEALAGVDTIDLPEKAPLQAASKNLESMVKWHQQLVVFRDWFNAVKPVEALPAFSAQHLTEARTSLDRLQKWVSSLTSLTSSLKALQDEWEVVLKEEKEAHDEVETLGVCPTCVQPLHRVE